MRVKEGDRPKTAFATHGGQFQWRVMPFGLTNGPVSFTRLMNLALSGLTWIYCLLYLYDIIIWALPLKTIFTIFDRIRAAATFLGQFVSSEGIGTDPEKAKAVETLACATECQRVSKFP